MNRDELLLKILDNFNSSDVISIKDLIMLFEDNKKIKDSYQYSLIPPWFKDEELIKAINNNFEKHQQAIREIINIINKGE